MIKATALKAFLQRNNIRPASLAKTCRLSKSYLSMLINAKFSNPRFPVLVRLAAALGLPVHVVQELLHTSFDSFISENIPKVLSEKPSQHHFYNYLQQILDASEQSDFSMIFHLNEVIRNIVPDSVPLKSYYLCWYEAYNLTFQDKSESAIPLFVEASAFTSRHEIEKRFKAKILLGLGAAYTVRGQYSQSIKVFRQSLLLWDKGFQVARVYMNMGTLYRRLAKYNLSVNAYEKAYEMGTSTVKLYAIAGLIQIFLDKKNYSSARKYVLKGYAQAKTCDSPRGRGDLYCNIAEYYSAIGKFHSSEVLFRKAILLADISGKLRTKHWAEVELAMLFFEQGLVKEFDTLIQRLESDLTDTEDVLLVAKHMNALGRQYLNQSKYSLVISISEKAYNLLNFLYPSPPSTELRECCQLLYEANTASQKPALAHFYLNEIKRIK